MIALNKIRLTLDNGGGVHSESGWTIARQFLGFCNVYQDRDGGQYFTLPEDEAIEMFLRNISEE